MKTSNTSKLFLTLFSGLCLLSQAQQTGPYRVRFSDGFDSPRKFRVMDPISYGDKGIIQVNARKKLKAYNFQLFSTDLKLKKESTVKMRDKLGDHVNFENFMKLKNKTYLFVREVFRGEEVEGISALEFDPDNLDFKGTSQNLFKSTGQVLAQTYSYRRSEDNTKFAYTYSLKPFERRDRLNKEVVGMQVFDENLTKIWGKDIEMPYTEAIMDNMGYTLTDDGKIVLLAKVFDDENRKRTKDGGAPNYHYEALVYDQGNPNPKIIQVKAGDYFPDEAYIYEDQKHSLFVAGFYSKRFNKPVDGAYVLELNIANSMVQRPEGGGFYEFPSELIKAYTSEREKRKLEKKEKKDPDGDLGIDNLRIRRVYALDDGSRIILSEQYHVVVSTYYNGKTTTTKYDTYANDIFLLKIKADGQMAWFQKIPKAQHSNGSVGAGISFTSFCKDNKLTIFYVDNINNYNLPINEAPKTHQDGRGGFITAAQVDEQGNVQKFNLGDVKDLDTHFYIRYFKDGGRSNLIDTERKKRENLLMSIDIL